MPENENNVPQQRFAIDGGEYVEVLFNTNRLVLGIAGDDGTVMLRWDVLDGELHFTHTETDGDVEVSAL